MGPEAGLPGTDGHAVGEEALLDTVWGALDVGIRYLTVYVFSTENWKRPVDEVRFLMGFNERLLMTRRDELHAKGVRCSFWVAATGGFQRVPWRITETEEMTRHNTTMTLSMAFNYGGRAELVDAVRAIARSGSSPTRSTRSSSAATSTTPTSRTRSWMIRTSGEHRISNFLL